MTTITIYGYVFNGKKWKYKQHIMSIELGYEDAKRYSKGLFKRLLMDKSLSLEGIAVSKIPDSEVTSKELHKNKVFAERIFTHVFYHLLQLSQQKFLIPFRQQSTL